MTRLPNTPFLGEVNASRSAVATDVAETSPSSGAPESQTAIRESYPQHQRARSTANAQGWGAIIAGNGTAATGNNCAAPSQSSLPQPNTESLVGPAQDVTPDHGGTSEPALVPDYERRDAEIYLLMLAAVRLAGYFEEVRDRVRPEHFDIFAETHYRVLWQALCTCHDQGIAIVVLSVAGMMWTFSGICRLFGALFLRHDPDYQEFRRRGGDPYFDLTLPPGINNDSLAVRWGGKPEPNTDFVPPQDWLWQCNSCGARNRDDQGNCWHCGNGLSNGPCR